MIIGRISKQILVGMALMFTGGAYAGETNTLAKALEPLRPLLGKTWKGYFKNSTPEKPVYDTAKWERAMNGQAVRVTHSVNDGKYGGESILMINPRTKGVEFYYFTTAGFFTHGTVAFEGAKIITHEEVTGNEEGTTETQATTELLRDGRMRVKTRYFKKGQWEDGRDMTYEVTPGAEVVFR